MTTAALELPPTLATPRLVLRAPLTQDAPTIFRAYAQDVAVARFMVWRPHVDLRTTTDFIATSIAQFQASQRLPYVLAWRDAPTVAIGMLEARIDQHRVDLGYVLARAAWGRGLMPEAVSALATTALDACGFHRVQAFCDVENRPSQRTLEKAGFVREGLVGRFVVHPNISDEPRDCFMYAKCR